MLLNVLIFAISNGLNSTIESFCSWDFGQHKNEECGYHLNRARIIVVLVLLPVFISFFWMDSILVSLGQNPEMSLIARNYCVWVLPGVFMIIQFDCTKRLLQSIQESQISTTVQFVTTVTHVGLCILFIMILKLEIFGAALAMNCTYGAAFLIQEFYIRVYASDYFSEFLQPLF